MIKDLIVFFVLAATATTAMANPDETVLLERTYKLKVQHGSFVCHNGVPPNGHNYPVPTLLTFELASHNLWLSDVWTNVDHYRFDSDYSPCSVFSNILRPAPQQDLIGVVTQRITETHRKNGFGKCMRVTREEAKLAVDGVILNGVNEFIVGPVNNALCK